MTFSKGSMLFIIVLVLSTVRSITLRELFTLCRNEAKLKEALFKAAEKDPCRKIKACSLKETRQRANKSCRDVLSMFMELPESLQYSCQKPSPPARCSESKSGRYECFFEAEYQTIPNSEKAPRFQARMAFCVNSMKYGRSPFSTYTRKSTPVPYPPYAPTDAYPPSVAPIAYPPPGVTPVAYPHISTPVGLPPRMVPVGYGYAYPYYPPSPGV